MMLLYDDLVQLFPNNKGICDPSLQFLTVTSYAKINQPKGIFIPLYKDSGELNEAINHGAIAALWDEKVPLPTYTPNQFIVFYCDDLLKGLKKMIELYRTRQKDMKEEQSEHMRFHLLPETSLNGNKQTYDLSVMINQLEQFMKDSYDGRGE